MRVLAGLTDREQLPRHTDLSTARARVERIRRDQPVAAAFVFSDVAHNASAVTEATEAATQLEGTPVYVIPIGNQSRLRDVDLVSVSAPAVAMRNDDVVIEAQVESLPVRWRNMRRAAAAGRAGG